MALIALSLGTACGGEDTRPMGQTAGIATTVGNAETGDAETAGSSGESEGGGDGEGGGETDSGSPEVCGNGLDDDGDGSIDEQCACTSGETQDCFPEGAEDTCPGVQTCSGAGEITSWGPCEVDLEACIPSGTSGGEDIDPCASEDLQTTTQVLTFQSPLETLGACPWAQGDNLGPTSGVMAARHEVTVPIEPPAGAVICATRFEVPETSMYYDDQLYILFNDVVILSPDDWSDLLMADNGLLIYEWLRIRGVNGSGTTYCPGAGSVCQLPDTQVNGSIDLELDLPTQQAVLERAASQGFYAVTVAATGDDNADIDCDHSTFDLEVTYDYVVP